MIRFSSTIRLTRYEINCIISGNYRAQNKWKLLRFKKTELARGDCSRFACDNEKGYFFSSTYLPFCSIIISDEAASLLGGAQPTYCLAESAIWMQMFQWGLVRIHFGARFVTCAPAACQVDDQSWFALWNWLKVNENIMPNLKNLNLKFEFYFVQPN